MNDFYQDMLYKKAINCNTNEFKKKSINFDLTVSAVKVIALGSTSLAGNFKVDVGIYRGVAAFASILTGTIDQTHPIAQFDVASGTIATSSLLSEDRVSVRITEATTDLTRLEVHVEYTI